MFFFDDMKKLFVILMALSGLTLTASAAKKNNVDGRKTAVDYVNPFVGTDGFGNVYPGAQVPFGGIQISPDTDEHFSTARRDTSGSVTRYKAFHLRISVVQVFLI